MTANLVPDWLRIILSILSFLSFLPQLTRLWMKKVSTGISLIYVLLNLISATEQFTLGAFFIIHSDETDIFVHREPITGDWLNMGQLTIVWLMSLILFFASILYSRVSFSAVLAGTAAIAIYLAFLSIPVVPLFAHTMQPGKGDYVKWFSGLFGGPHIMFVNPVVTLGCILAPIFQVQNAMQLDLFGLVSQASVFLFVALSSIWRVKWFSEGSFPVSWGGLGSWYQTVGWVAVDNGIFAVGQLGLFCVARYKYRALVGELNVSGGEVLSDEELLAEEEPLLAPQVG